jgi:hypothetical protein
MKPDKFKQNKLCGDRFEPVIGGSTGVGGWGGGGGGGGGGATGVHHPSPPLVVVSSNPLKKLWYSMLSLDFPIFELWISNQSYWKKQQFQLD